MDVFFQQHPDVIIATNTFRKVPTILQYEEEPLIQVVHCVDAGYTTRLTVFHNDGTKIAVVKGAQIYKTPEGEKANVTMRYPDRCTIVELEGKTILELHRDAAAALRGWAELYAPEGVLIKAHSDYLSAVRSGSPRLEVCGIALSGGLFQDLKIGIHVTRMGMQVGGPDGTVTGLKANEWRLSTLPGGSATFKSREVVPYREIDSTKKTDGEGTENPAS